MASERIGADDDGTTGTGTAAAGGGGSTALGSEVSTRDSAPRPQSVAQQAASHQTDDPDEIAADIERTRDELAETLDAIAYKVNPKRVVESGKEQARDAAKDYAATATALVAQTSTKVRALVSQKTAQAKAAATDKVAATKTSVSQRTAKPPTPSVASSVAVDPAASANTVLPPVTGAPGGTSSAGASGGSGGGASALLAQLPALRAKLPVSNQVLGGGGAALLGLLLLVRRRRR